MRAARRGGVFDLTLIEHQEGMSTLRVSGKGAHEAFAHEAGGHRWQRVPPNEKRGRVHTSTITVAVLPEPTMTEIVIAPNDLEWTFCRGSGAGGQHRNKTETTAVLVHRPTGTMVRCETERSQHQNKALALALLRARLFAARRGAAVKDRADERKRQVGSGMRGDKRRTIRCQDGIVTDHELGRQWSFRDYERGSYE